MTHKIVDQIPNEQVQSDLEKYRQKALKLGAADAKIVTTDMIMIDERVRAKCLNPKCPSYGTNANCPPYTMSVDDTRRVVNNFHSGIFTIIQTPFKVMAGNSKADKNARIRARMKSHEMISKLESQAFYDGYHLALGLAGGPCKNLFCPNKECSALIPGQGCRNALKSRPSMEAVGMNAYGMAAAVGWDIYPIGQNAPDESPLGTVLGLVLVY